WKREVVYRYNSNAIDVYYRTPDNKKLRSRREVLEYLKPRSRLKIDNFTFARKPLGLDSSKEICRRAYSSKKVVNNHDSAAINKNKNEDQIMESDVEVENPNNLQSEVVNNHDGAAIDKNKTEEQTVELYFIAAEEGAGNNNFHNEKLSIINFKVITGSGLVNNFLNSKYMLEIHWPGYNYLGPFTKSKKPINKLDEAAMEHDFYYEKHTDTKSRHKAGLILENISKDIYKNPEISLGEKTAALQLKEKRKSKLELKFEQIKHGGFLPLLFVEIETVSALAGGISAIANTIIEGKHKRAVEKEQE
ncbi:Methyl-CpG DNA binding,Parvovirus coat protein VP1, N-terminal,DNA-binding domain, partial [Cinara cedri]